MSSIVSFRKSIVKCDIEMVLLSDMQNCDAVRSTKAGKMTQASSVEAEESGEEKKM